MLLHSVPVAAGDRRHARVGKRDLTTASAGVSDAMARMRAFTKSTGEDSGAPAYRQAFLVVVRPRAVIANSARPDRTATPTSAGFDGQRSRTSTASSPRAAPFNN